MQVSQARYDDGVGQHRCGRCEADVAGEYPNPRLRKLAKVYFLLPIPFVPLLPIIASDFIVMIPLTMLYLLGIGPALAWTNAKPVCPTCGAFVHPR